METALPSGLTRAANATPPRLPIAAIGAGLLSWIFISLGFYGLHGLMQVRPEFVGQPMHESRTQLLQEAPRLAIRKVSDDVSVIKTAQPDASEVTFTMRGGRDFRGLRTVMDMSGEMRARHTLKNPYDEPIYVLFRCAHPRAERDGGQSLQAAGLKLEASVPGLQENTADAWQWSGTLGAHQSVEIQISYQAASLNGVTYRIGGQNAAPVKHVRLAFQREDLPAMRFQSGEGLLPGEGAEVVWERSDFLAPDSFTATLAESRNLYGSLQHLLEIGPVICLLFLLAVTAVILARQPISAVQMLTISAGYALYFPLVVYLSSRFSFLVALILALLVPGVLLLNYTRLLLGARVGLLGGIFFLALYQLFPTLAAFAGWNRGMVLLALGVVTFAVLINLQNRTLRKGLAAALCFTCWGTASIRAADVQVMVPGQLLTTVDSRMALPPPLLSLAPADYQIREEEGFLRIEAQLVFKVIRAGSEPVALFTEPVNLQRQEMDPSAAEIAELVTIGEHLGLFAKGEGAGSVRFSYRVAVTAHENGQRVRIPLIVGPSGNIRFESVHPNLEVTGGTLWTKSAQEKGAIYEIGVAGEKMLTLTWRDTGGGMATGAANTATGGLYGIGITRAQHLTVVNSDGSCLHFAELELPAGSHEELRLRLPPQVRLISMSVNGSEVTAPALEDQVCRVPLPDRAGSQATHRLSFRLSYPPVRLGFLGALELALPEAFQTIGTLEWIIALPSGFETQVLSSGLETQKSPPDLGQFGDYGRVLKARLPCALAKDLTPPGPIAVSLHYRQAVPALEGL